MVFQQESSDYLGTMDKEDNNLDKRHPWLTLSLSMGGKILLPLLAAYLFMYPRLDQPNLHPLHDVGFNLQVLADLDGCEGITDYLETAAENRPQRFYPAYWLGQHLLWRLGGRSLDLFYPANLVMLFLLFAGMALLTARLGGPGGLAVILMAMAPGMVENCHTIMKQELPLALAQLGLLLCLLPLLRRQRLSPLGLSSCALGAAIAIIFSGLLKETAAIAGFAIFCWLGQALFFSRQPRPSPGHTIVLSGLAILSIALGAIAFMLREKGEYTAAISFSPMSFATVAWLYSRLLWPWVLLGLAAAIMIFLRPRTRKTNNAFFLVFLFACGWLTGYLPWRTPQIRYLLPGFCMLIPFICGGLGKSQESPSTRSHFLKQPVTYLYSAIFLLASCFLFSRINEAQIRSTADQSVSAICGWLNQQPPGDRVLVLLPEDEPIQELRDQLTALYGRGDLVVEPALKGRHMESWIEGFKKLAASPPVGDHLIIPYANDTTKGINRVFPVNDKRLADTLYFASKNFFGSSLMEIDRFPRSNDLPQAGFIIFQFVKTQ